MPVHVRFHCQFCRVTPDAATQRALEHSLRELAFGQYLESRPGRWLVWLGGGALGPRRYACSEHRGELTADVREHYGTIAPQPWRRPPYPETVRTADTDRAIRQGAFSSLPKWASR